MSAKFHIEKQAGVFTSKSRDALKEQFNALEDGEYEILIAPKKGYKATRYKWYFDCVMWQILCEAGRYYRIVNPNTGEERTPVSTVELHTCMKAIYNPVTLTIGNKTRVIAGTTTDLNDREFLVEYLEQIIADHSGPPYNIQFVTYEEWKSLHASNSWHMVKEAMRK